MSKDWGVVRRTDWESVLMPPTKRCLICDKLENPDAHTVHDVGWLCPECKSRIQRVLYPKETEK